MNEFPSPSVVARIRAEYPAGCRVALVSMGPDPYSRLKPGDEGTVFHVDDAGTVHVNWDCGSTLTVRKDGKELTFKTETGDLRRDCTGGYSHWHMIAADRRRFFECFGRNAEYRPEEILRITYGRSILYEANG